MDILKKNRPLHVSAAEADRADVAPVWWLYRLCACEGVVGAAAVQLHLFLTSALHGSDQLHAPAALPQGTHWIEDWVDPRASMDVSKVAIPTELCRFLPVSQRTDVVNIDLRLPSRRWWHLRHSAILHGVVWYLFTDVSGQRIGPIFTDQESGYERKKASNL
jgi:hypothetical protein